MSNRNITQQDRENAARLKALWEALKGPLGLTQKIAAERLGYGAQSMISQTLNCTVGLNTDQKLKWAQLLGVNPADIDPKLKSLNFTPSKMRLLKVAIIARMSGEPAGPFESLEIMTQTTRQVYGISVDTDGFAPFAKKGSTLIVSQEEEPVSGDEVFIRIALRDGPLHMIKHYITTDAERGVAIVADIDGGNREELPLDVIEVLDPIISVERPPVKRPIRLRPKSATAI